MLTQILAVFPRSSWTHNPRVFPKKLFQPPIRGEIRNEDCVGFSEAASTHSLHATKTSTTSIVKIQNLISYCGRFLNKTFQATVAVVCTATTQLSKNKYCRQQIFFDQFHPSKKAKILTQVKYTSTYQCANKHLVLETPWHTCVAQ